MKRLVCLVALLVLTACAPASVSIIPPGTLAAQTLAALPTPFIPTDTPIPATATETPSSAPPTPALNLSIPGAYCLPANAPRIQALVTKVLDGDTLEAVAGLQSFNVRLIGMDAPAIASPPEWQAGQAYGFLSNLVSGKVVTLVQDVTPTDQDGVQLRYVVVDNAFVNYEMVRLGYGRISSMSPNIACDNSLIAAQVEAQTAVRGMWQPTPVPTFTITFTPTITTTPLPSTATSEPPCTCNTRKSCSQFTSQRAAQACYNYCMKNFNVPVLQDQNNNGRVCEGLP